MAALRPRVPPLLAVALAVGLCAACRGAPPCVPVAADERGTVERQYDEFTGLTTVTASLVLTPDQEWELRDYRHDGQITWAVLAWLQARSDRREIELVLRPTCSAVPESEGERGRCLNCDNLCSAGSGGLEAVVDGRPLALPRSSYERRPTEAPAPGSPATWVSVITLRAPPEALRPLTVGRSVKLRACRSLVVTLSAGEQATLAEALRHGQAIMPPPRPPGPRRAAAGPPRPPR